MRVYKGDDAAAAHHELVYRVSLRVGQRARMGEKQHADAARDTHLVQRDEFHLETVGQFSVNQKWLRLALHGGKNAARARVQRQVGDDAQQVFPAQTTIRPIVPDHIPDIADGHRRRTGSLQHCRQGLCPPDRNKLFAFADRLGYEPLCNSLILSFGKRRGVNNLQINHAIGGIGHFFQHIAHALGIYLQARLRRPDRANNKISASPALSAATEYCACRGLAYKALFGQVEPRTAQKHGSE